MTSKRRSLRVLLKSDEPLPKHVVLPVVFRNKYEFVCDLCKETQSKNKEGTCDSGIHGDLIVCQSCIKECRLCKKWSCVDCTTFLDLGSFRKFVCQHCYLSR